MSKNPDALKRLRQEQGRDDHANVVSERLKLARIQHLPALTARRLVDEIRSRFGLDIDENSIHKIENQQRGVHDYEVKCFAIVLGVSADWLLGITDQPATQPSGNFRCPSR